MTIWIMSPTIESKNLLSRFAHEFEKSHETLFFLFDHAPKTFEKDNRLDFALTFITFSCTLISWSDTGTGQLYINLHTTETG